MWVVPRKFFRPSTLCWGTYSLYAELKLDLQRISLGTFMSRELISYHSVGYQFAKISSKTKEDEEHGYFQGIAGPRTCISTYR